MRKRRGSISYNHTTFIDGLEPYLKNLSTHPEIKRITPGMIRHTTSNQPQLLVKILQEPVLGGYKLVARKGKSVQDIFLITTLQRETLTKLL